MSERQHDLFGGAIVCVLPQKAIDASDLRQIPDTQEVFVMPDSDLSIIFEILEAVDCSELLGALRYHFDAIAHDNEATWSVVADTTAGADVTFGGQSVQCGILKGTQRVSKFNKPPEESDLVHISLALWRIPAKRVDLVAIVNDPEPRMSAEGDKFFQKMQETLEIRDFALFASALDEGTVQRGT